MQIRTRLTVQFLLLGGIIMIIASLAIYFSSSAFRKEDFFNRLNSKGMSAARLLFDAREIDPDRVRRIEEDNPANLHNEKIIILNFRNDTIYSSDEHGEIEINNNLLERIRLHDNITYRQGPYEVLGKLYVAKFDRFVLITAATDIDGFMHLKKLRLILVIVSIFSLILFSVAGWFYSGRALKPISEVIRSVEDISITSLNLRVFEGNGTDEIGRLAKTFNKILERLETSFMAQKDFIANASHELRTPLTSINGQLEVLLLKNRSSAEYKSALESILDDIKSLIDLSNRLLLIARTSSESPVKLYSKIRLDEILWQVEEEIKKFNNNYHINLIIDGALTDSDQMIVLGDEYLLRVAISNIIENACKYSPDNTVDVKFEFPEKWVEVIFEDRGIGIPAEEIRKVFEPFYRASNASSFHGSGIGLPLVTQIIRNHDGQIKLTSVIGKGTIVKLRLPLIS